MEKVPIDGLGESVYKYTSPGCREDPANVSVDGPGCRENLDKMPINGPRKYRHRKI